MFGSALHHHLSCERFIVCVYLKSNFYILVYIERFWVSKQAMRFAYPDWPVLFRKTRSNYSMFFSVQVPFSSCKSWYSVQRTTAQFPAPQISRLSILAQTLQSSTHWPHTLTSLCVFSYLRVSYLSLCVFPTGVSAQLSSYIWKQAIFLISSAHTYVWLLSGIYAISWKMLSGGKKALESVYTVTPDSN